MHVLYFHVHPPLNPSVTFQIIKLIVIFGLMFNAAADVMIQILQFYTETHCCWGFFSFFPWYWIHPSPCSSVILLSRARGEKKDRITTTSHETQSAATQLQHASWKMTWNIKQIPLSDKNSTETRKVLFLLVQGWNQSTVLMIKYQSIL